MPKSDYYTKVCEDLEQLPTLTQRLDYWKNNIYSKVGADFKRIAKLFSTKEDQISPLSIPKTIWEDYFESQHWKNIEIGGHANRIHSNEYNDWMTGFFAFEYSNDLIKNFREDLKKSNDPKFLVDAELNRILQFELDIKGIVGQSTFSIGDFKNNKEGYEYYRFLMGEYKGEQHSYGDLLIKTIAKHKYFKPHLQKLSKEGLLENKDIQSTKKAIGNNSVPMELFSDDKIICSFKWIGNDVVTQITKLHFLLIKEGYIPSNTTPKTFLDAFQGQQLIEHINIRWIKKVKGKLSKPLLFYFINELELKKLIEGTFDNRDLFKKIENIFADPEGNKLQNLGQSKRFSNTGRKKDKTHQEKGIDIIINQII